MKEAARHPSRCHLFKDVGVMGEVGSYESFGLAALARAPPPTHSLLSSPILRFQTYSSFFFWPLKQLLARWVNIAALRLHHSGVLSAPPTLAGGGGGYSAVMSHFCRSCIPQAGIRRAAVSKVAHFTAV